MSSIFHLLGSRDPDQSPAETRDIDAVSIVLEAKRAIAGEAEENINKRGVNHEPPVPRTTVITWADTKRDVEKRDLHEPPAPRTTVITWADTKRDVEKRGVDHQPPAPRTTVITWADTKREYEGDHVERDVVLGAVGPEVKRDVKREPTLEPNAVVEVYMV
ncbi:hypothetical protein UCRPA7_5877 [Phaeoacremonium minimum UCRPA7]|uniref:Uncharacterized protein n=1 Tax=Phaeoacremonium minimum (strain UCR-PA7) TaxID=1286976 RepID=R8BGY5_PHAM7|nr:hypothetical protein UCRPA7_5877 [Phaeoacremonium minimum UCRPA7]EON98605.1 hypothetical protein UCRPA7_5877 [Phaeoacremonium minimum UCRPA7]